jgi:hypothetical protein
MPKSGDAAFNHGTNSCAQTIHTLGVNGFGLNYSHLAVRFRNNGCAYSTTGTCLYPRSSLELNPWTRGSHTELLPRPVYS